MQRCVGVRLLDGYHRRLARKRSHVRAAVAVRLLGNLAQVQVRGAGQAARVQLEDCGTRLRIGQRDLDLSVEAPRATQRRVQRVGTISGADHQQARAGWGGFCDGSSAILFGGVG